MLNEDSAADVSKGISGENVVVDKPFDLKEK